VARNPRTATYYIKEIRARHRLAAGYASPAA